MGVSAIKQVNEGLTLNMVATADISHNEIVVIGARIGVAATAATTGQTVGIHLEGVFIIPAEQGTPFAVGEDLYWDTTNNCLTKTAGSVKAGFCTLEKAASDSTAWVKING
jgi:Uncharacterized conserved protein